MTPPSTGTSLGGFSAVDAAGGDVDLVAALDDIAAFPAVQRLRAAATGLLAPRGGDRVVDVGCGSGDQVRALAAAVGPTGSVVGIDPSATMLDEARRRTAEGQVPVEYRLGDATHLDIDDVSVDGSRCERVFQHLADPAAAMAELVRITRPGGRIVVIDTDWGMHAIHGADPDVTARIVACWAGSAANGWSGRRLPGLFAAAGIDQFDVVAETFTSLDPQAPARPRSRRWRPLPTTPGRSHAMKPRRGSPSSSTQAAGASSSGRPRCSPSADAATDSRPRPYSSGVGIPARASTSASTPALRQPS